MWIYTKDGFISAVAHEDNEELGTDDILVRARVRQDLVNFLDLCTEGTKHDLLIVVNHLSDYKYRVVLDREMFARGVARCIMQLDYTNFKGNFKNLRHDIYLDVYNVTYALTVDEPDL